MHIYFDCTILQNWQGHFTGIQRVIFSLAKGFAELEHKHVVPIVVSVNGTARIFDIDNLTVGDEFEVSKGDVVLTASPNWDFPEIEKNLKHYRSNGALIVSVLYDIIPWKLPHSYGPGFPDIYNAWLNRMVLSSDGIVSISENSLKDLKLFCKLNDLKIPKTSVFRLGDDINEFSKIHASYDLEEGFRKKYTEKFIISVGTIEYRKNHILLLNALRNLKLSSKVFPYKLYIIGKEGWLNSDVRYQIDNDPLLEGSVEILEGVSDQELDFLYSNCEFTVYPSIYEGWGLPVAESLRYGKACVASNSSSLIEIAPTLVTHLNPFDTVAWSDELVKLSDPRSVSNVTQNVQLSYIPFSWKESARVLEVFLTSEFN